MAASVPLPPGPVADLQIHRLDPPGAAVTQRVRSSFDPGAAIPARPDASSSSSPRPVWFFHDAVAVRWKVFIDEQKCGWDVEVDEDDARSWHFNAAAPGLAPLSPPPAPAPSSTTTTTDATTDATTAATSSSLSPADASEYGSRVLATIRLVPGPHAAHPRPGSVDFAGGTAPDPGRTRPGHRDVATAMHDGRELYAKLGRLATLQEARGKGLARRLVEHALAWAAGNAARLDRVVVAAAAADGATEGGREAGTGNGDRGEDGEGGMDEDTGRVWKGLVMVHSQLDVAPMYAKCGFVEDKELGMWVEEGISHVAMWRRLKIPGRS